MKHIRLGALTLLGIVAAVGVMFVVKSTLAQRPEVKFKDGHRSPLMAEITFRDGTKRTVMVVASGFSIAKIANPHTFAAVGPGDSEVSIWLDTISTINEITDKEATFLMKNGMERRLKFKYDSGQLVDALFLSNDDGGTEMVQASKVRQVKFLKPPRMDKENHAMLDDWRYSPYTGEKLPPVE